MNTLGLLSDARYFDESNARASELRQLLDSRDARDKLDAMKRLIALMTLGRDVSSFFADVVKNVIVESQEVKKLVYMYLIHYAEQNQELALLSINTFQKDLSSSSQRIRANALKAMSSIRLPVAIPLVVLAVRTSVKDTSSYVRRASAAAIVKVYSVEPEQKDVLVPLIGELLTNTEPLVLGAALFAFHEVCPDNFDLIHQNFRKICHLLADFDEWGQIIALTVLLRYARTQFLSPFTTDAIKEQQRKIFDENKPFYSDEENEENEEEKEEELKKENNEPEYIMDEDHRLLLRQACNLLYSPNAGVVVGVANLYYHLAPVHELSVVVRPLVRTSRNKRSIQFPVLATISTLCEKRADLFRPYLKDFFIYSSEPLYIRELKLDILATIATEANISLILKEFQCYTHDSNKEFVSKTIAAIGRCAQSIPNIAEKCIRGLLGLVTSKSESVVAESVIIIRQLLQANPTLSPSIIKTMARLLPKIHQPIARSGIVWMIGEYREKIPKIAPDSLRVLASSFRDEEEIVKMQILNLSVKLFLSQPKQTSLLFKYIMELSRYDKSFDIRDRARLYRALFFKKKQGKDDAKEEKEKDGASSKEKNETKEAMKSAILGEKPAPKIVARMVGRDRYQFGSLSHMINERAVEYLDLPIFPEVAPDPNTRKPKQLIEEETKAEETQRKKDKKKKKKDRGSGSDRDSDDERSGSEKDSDFSSVDEESASGSDSDKPTKKSRRRRKKGSDESGSDKDSDKSDSDVSDSDEDGKKKRKTKKQRGSDDEDDDDESEKEDGDGSDSENDKDAKKKKKKNADSEDDADSGEDSEDRGRRLHRRRKRSLEEDEEDRRKAEEDEADEEAEAASRKHVRDEVDLLDLDKIDEQLSSASSALGNLERSAISSAKYGQITEDIGKDEKSDVDATSPRQPVTPTTAQSSTPSSVSSSSSSSTSDLLSGVSYPKAGARGILLNPIQSGGLAIDFVFSRKPSLYGKNLSAVDLILKNQSSAPFEDLKLTLDSKAGDGPIDAKGTDDVTSELGVGEENENRIHIDFRGKTSAASFTLQIKRHNKIPLKLAAPVGELFRPATVNHQQFQELTKKLSGMNEQIVKITLKASLATPLNNAAQKILEVANVSALSKPKENVLRFAAQKLFDDSYLLIQLTVQNNNASNNAELQVNHGDFMVAGHVLELIKKALA